MKGSFKIMNLQGINIFIHWTFFLLAGWIVMVNIRYVNDVRQLGWTILFILAAVVSVTLHEAGHAIMASWFGVNAKNIVLLPIGGVASIEKFPDNPGQELAISIAGPLVNVIIALLLWWITIPHTSFWALPEDMGNAPGRGFLYILRMGNLGLAAFNLIPAFPMDGGRILRALLGFKLNYVRATTVAAIIGKVIAVAFIGLGIVLLSPLLVVIGVFIVFSAGTEEHYLRLKSLVKGIKLNEVLMYDFTSLQADITVHQAADVLINNHSKHFILMEGDLPAGSINRLEIIKAMAEMKYNDPVRSLIKEDLECLDGEQDVATVLEKLAKDEERVFPVMDQGRFAGIVNLDHVIEYLLLHKAGSNDFSRLKSLVGLMH